MFNGIVETIGHIESLVIDQGCKHFVITPEIPFLDLHSGDSVAVNGVCLTVTTYTDHHFSVTAVPETLSLTNLNSLLQGHVVNLERAMRLNQRVGGHFVQGHVDGMGEITNIQDEQGALRVTIQAPHAILRYAVPKGFIAIDGMSITLIDVTDDYFTVTFVPHTIQHTLVKHYHKGSIVNLEADIFSKTMAQLLQKQGYVEK